MPIGEVQRSLERRRVSLVKILNNENLPIEKQHQVYGAIKEIENVLKALDYHKQQDILKGFKVELKNDKNKSLFTRIFNK
jgi:hypothetical protein